MVEELVLFTSLNNMLCSVLEMPLEAPYKTTLNEAGTKYYLVISISFYDTYFTYISTLLSLTIVVV